MDGWAVRPPRPTPPAATGRGWPPTSPPAPARDRAPSSPPGPRPRTAPRDACAPAGQARHHRGGYGRVVGLPSDRGESSRRFRWWIRSATLGSGLVATPQPSFAGQVAACRLGPDWRLGLWNVPPQCPAVAGAGILSLPARAAALGHLVWAAKVFTAESWGGGWRRAAPTAASVELLPVTIAAQ